MNADDVTGSNPDTRPIGGAVSHDTICEAKRHAALAVVVDSCRRRRGTHSHSSAHSRVAAMVIPRRIDEHTCRSSSCANRRTDNDHHHHQRSDALLASLDALIIPTLKQQSFRPTTPFTEVRHNAETKRAG